MSAPIHRRTVLATAAGLAAAPAILAATGQGASAQQRAVGSGLTARQLAGQRVIHSYAGLTPPKKLVQHIRDGLSAGVIFSGGNISDPDQIAEVTAQLRDAAKSGPTGSLLLMTDQEGGQVRRLPGDPTLSEKQVGAQDHPTAAARTAGTGAGNNLAAAGMNVNLAPVLGVYRHSGDFLDQYGRSYGQDAGAVNGLGAAFVTAQRKTGVAATAKHFPGLGAAGADENTDEVPVTLSVPTATLRSVDEAAYPDTIDAGVELVMLSWAVYPHLDDRPAGLSSTIIGNELRGRLGFTGVTVTDALGAGALRDYGDMGQRAVSAAHAGMDLMLCSGGLDIGEQAVTGLADALKSGDLPDKAFHTAVDRVAALRAALG